MLDFRNLTFSSFSRRVRAIMPPHSNFGLNRTIWSRVMPKNDFQYGVRPPSWIWEFLNFCHVSVALLKISVCVPDFVKFGRFAAEIWSYNDFQNGGRPPWWIFEIWHFHHLTFVCMRLCPRTRNFVLIGQYGAKKWFSVWRPSAILNLGISDFFLTFPSIGSKLASEYQISSYSDDSRLRYGYITIFKMAAVRHVGFIVTSSYCAGSLSLTLLTLC